MLVPVPGEGVPERHEVTIDGSTAGRAFRRVEAVRSPASGGPAHLWVPLLDGAERIGVLELGVDDAPDEAFTEEARAFASLVAELTVSRDAYSDALVRLRRRRSMSLAAEIQWSLMPPLTTPATGSCSRMPSNRPTTSAGTPSTTPNGPHVDFVILDAVGHGVQASLLAPAAVGTYRHARRDGLELTAPAAMDDVVAEQFRPPGSSPRRSPGSTRRRVLLPGSTAVPPPRWSCAAAR